MARDIRILSAFCPWFGQASVARAVVSPLILMLWAGTAAGAESLQFNRDIRPILAAKCFACHGPDEHQRKADLRLDSREGIESAFAGGELEASEAWTRISSDDDDVRMPPPSTHLRLTAEEIQRLRRWIEAGAAWLGSLVEGGRVVLVCEDAQWIDPSTLELLSLIRERAANSALLLVCAFRPSFRSPWLEAPDVVQLTLGTQVSWSSQPLVTLPSPSKKPAVHEATTHSPTEHPATALGMTQVRPQPPQFFGSELISIEVQSSGGRNDGGGGSSSPLRPDS